MRLPPFALERYFGEHEFNVPHLLCASDCESWTVEELLALEPDAQSEFHQLGLGYTECTGSPALRRAIAALYRDPRPDQILVHVGAEEAIFVLMNVLLDPGDEVVVQMPAYQSLHEVARGAGATVVPWETHAENGWALDPDVFEALLTPKTRAVVLNLPHSPTGYLPDAETFAELVAVARKHGVWLVCDEVYRGLEHDPAHRIGAAVDRYERGVSIGVVSKAHGLAGLRIGWIACRDRDLIDRAIAFKDYTTICAPAPSEFLAALGLRHADTLIARNRELVLSNLDALRGFMDRHADRLDWVPPRAGPVAFPRVLGTGGAEAFCKSALDEKGVLLLPGSMFDRPEHLRIGFGRRGFVPGLQALEAVLS